MAAQSPLYRLIESQIEGTLADFVAARRGSGSSWTDLAAELTQLTQVEISDETIRRWFADRLKIEVTVA